MQNLPKMVSVYFWLQARAGKSYNPLSEASSPPVGGFFRFMSEEIWQNDVHKLHFLPFQPPLSEAPAPPSEDFWRHLPDTAPVSIITYECCTSISWLTTASIWGYCKLHPCTFEYPRVYHSRHTFHPAEQKHFPLMFEQLALFKQGHLFLHPYP